MTATTYRFPTAFNALTEEHHDAIRRVVASNRFTLGPESEALEVELAAYHGRRYAIACNSGSSANLLAVAALAHLYHEPRRDRLTAVVPALAWATTYAPLVQHDFRLIFSDCDDTWNAPANPRVADLLVACPVLGNPAHLPAWETHAAAHGIPLIEDACESLGALVYVPSDVIRSGSAIRRTGTFGIASTLSFFWSHQLNGIEGGAILTDDPDLNRFARMLRDHGMDRSVRDPSTPVAFADEYRFEVFGYNLRPLEVNAAVARVSLARLDETLGYRRANLYRFNRALAGLPVRTPMILPRTLVSPFGLQLELASPDVRERVVRALRAASIDCRPPTGGSFLRHAYGAPYVLGSPPTPVADRLHDRALFLGNAPFPIPGLIDEAVAVIAAALHH